MCVNKAGCQCHWSNDGPDRSRLRFPATPARQAPLGPPPTPLRTANSINSPLRSPASTRKRKRPANSTHKTPAKCLNTGSSTAVFGVGPSLTPVHEDVRTSFDNEPSTRRAFPSLTKEHHATSTNRHEIWGFMRPVNKDSSAIYSDPSSVLEAFPRLTARPKSDYVGCLLCEADGRRTLYKNHNNPQTTTLTNHLGHHSKWADKCREQDIIRKLPSKKSLARLESVQDEPYTPEGLLHYLTRWIAVDDQSVNAVESLEFRQLLLYCGRQIKDKDIPHRTKMAEALKTLFERMMGEWIAEVQNCPGRVSFTTDLWTDPNLHPFMAVTAHFIQEKDSAWTLEARLIAFESMPGSHDGETLGNTFVDILERHKLAHKVGQITADNASNNGSMMEAMENALISRGIPFSRSENCVRCFPHVINLAVHDFLDAIKHLDNHFGISNDVYDAIRADPIKRCRELVAAIRLTSQRREEFRKTVADARRNGTFDGDQLELLRDMTVRWSSTFNMIDRFLRISSAVDLYLARPNSRDLLLSHGMDETHLKVLDDIHKVLLLPHSIQELMSSEHTPTASVSLLAYEYLLQSLYELVQNDTFPHLTHAIYRAIDKIEKYVKIARKNRVYGMSMFINPCSKKTWMTAHWPEAEVEVCMDAIREAMIAYKEKEIKKELRRELVATSESATSSSSTIPGTSSHNQAHKNLQSGFHKLRAWSAIVTGSAPSSQPSALTNFAADKTPLSAEEIGTQAREYVDRELHLYLSHPGLNGDVSACDLLAFWQTYHQTYPILWKVARDILPAQASSVSCERIFSSAKLTTTVQRNRMSPKLVEMLQILKFGLKQDKLTFTSDWVMTPEKIYSQPPLTRLFFSRPL